MVNPTQNSIQIAPLQVAFTLSVANIPADVQAKALDRAKEAYVMALLEAGEISSGKAANLLNISRLEMIDRMGEWGISLFDDSLELEDLHHEVDQAQAALEQHSA